MLEKSYHEIKKALSGLHLPVGVIDKGYLEKNIRLLVSECHKARKKIRINTTQIKSFKVIQQFQAQVGSEFIGFACDTMEEAKELIEKQNVLNVIVTTPSVKEEDISLYYDLIKIDQSLSVSVDSPEHVRAYLNHPKFLESTDDINISLDIDMSWGPYGGQYRFGSKISRLNDISEVEELLKFIEHEKRIVLKGIITHEKLGYFYPEIKALNFFKKVFYKLVQYFGKQYIFNYKKDIHDLLKRIGKTIKHSSSYSPTIAFKENNSNELVVGSEILNQDFSDPFYEASNFQPSFYLAYMINRFPEPDIICTHSKDIRFENIYDANIRPAGLSYTLDHFQFNSQMCFKNKGYTPLEVGDPLLFSPSYPFLYLDHFGELVFIEK